MEKIDRQTEHMEPGKDRLSADQQSGDQGGAGLNNNTLGTDAMPAQGMSGMSGQDTSSGGSGYQGVGGGGTTGRSMGSLDINPKGMGSSAENRGTTAHVGGPVRSGNNSVESGSAQGIQGSNSGSSPQERGANLTTAPVEGEGTGGMQSSSDTTTLASANRDQGDTRTTSPTP